MSDTALAAPRSTNPFTGLMSGTLGPVLVVVLAILAIWYVAAVSLNTPFQQDMYERANQTDVPMSQLVRDTLAQERPVLPAPHQVIVEIWNTTVEKKITSKRSLIYHSGITLSSTLLGFLIGTLLGILLAVGIVHSRVLDKSLMPWVISLANHSDPRHRADDHCGFERGRHLRIAAEGDDFNLPFLLPGDRGHGERPALSGSHPYGSDAHLFRNASSSGSGNCACPTQFPTSSHP